MKTRLTIIFILFCSIGLYSQSNTDIQKLSKACELWGLIKYFHPDKPGHYFDSAFAANVPKMLEAKNESEWGDILTEWLNILNDSITKVVSDKGTKAENIYKSEFTTDSILFVKISGIKLYEEFHEGESFFEALKEQLKNSKKGIIFDLRQERLIPTEYEGYLNYFFETIPELSTEIVPQYKTIYYSGFVPETGSTSGGYTVNQVIQNAIDVGEFQTENQKIAWIVNKFSELPVVALSHQASGIGVILGDSENLTYLIPLSTNFNLSEKLSVKFKSTDIVLPNNSHLTVNYNYTESENPVEISKNILSNWIVPRSVESISGKGSSKNINAYPQDSYPPVGYRILAAAKIFSIIETFFPYYNLMDKDWRTVLIESLPDFVNAQNDIEYGLAVAKMYANINDSHGYIRGNKGLAQLQGQAPSPVSVDWIENKIVITNLRNDSICQALGLKIGDIILKVNGVPIDELMIKYEMFYAHSTKDYIRKKAAQNCIRGTENEEGIFTIQNDKGILKELKIRYSNSYNENFSIKHSLDTIVLFNEKIGYADLTQMETRQTDEMFEKFKNTKAIIFDMRGYPKGTAWSIAPRLTENKNVSLALFRKPEVLSPNIKTDEILVTKSYTEFIQTVATSDKWKYQGKTIMLIDHNAISQSEHTGLFFESVNNTIFIGSPTAGANGDVTNFQIPGGMVLNFSGQGVWHADNRQLQRKGLQPHVLVKPTINGIRAGKDEVLDKAIDWIGKNVK